MKDIAEQRAKKFYELRHQGMSVEEIADTYFLTTSRVYQIIAGYERKLQLPTTKPPRPPRKSDVRAQKLRDLRLKGYSLEDIGRTYGITRQRVDQIIQRYEHKYNLPSSTPASKEIIRYAKQADYEEYQEEQRIKKQKQRKLFVPSFQLDAHLVGRFLHELGTKWNKSVLYGFDGKSRSNPNARKDGTPYPSMDAPTNIFINKDGRHITVHSWVLRQYGITLEENQHCHHVDGDVTNNMLENLQVLSNVDHGKVTMQHYYRRKKLATGQMSLDFGLGVSCL